MDGARRPGAQPGQLDPKAVSHLGRSAGAALAAVVSPRCSLPSSRSKVYAGRWARSQAYEGLLESVQDGTVAALSGCTVCLGSDAAGDARARPCPGSTRTDLDSLRGYVWDKPGCLRHVTLACYVLGQPGSAKKAGTSATKCSGPRRSANYHHGAAAVGDAVLADRAEEHARELSVAVTSDDDEIGGLREGLEQRCRMPLDN